MSQGGSLRDRIAGYVLAGGRSSRMGRDKALLELGGTPLIGHAVEKLRGVVGEVRILSSRKELARYASLVPDLRKGRGPLGGLEAALKDARSEWVLVLPVDVPLVPGVLLRRWTKRVMQMTTARIALFAVDGTPQPALCLLHREVLPFVSEALDQSKLKLYPVFEDAGGALAALQDVSMDDVLLLKAWNEGELERFLQEESASKDGVTESERSVRHLWFANLNTPEEFAAVESAWST